MRKAKWEDDEAEEHEDATKGKEELEEIRDEEDGAVVIDCDEEVY